MQGTAVGCLQQHGGSGRHDVPVRISVGYGLVGQSAATLVCRHNKGLHSCRKHHVLLAVIVRAKAFLGDGHVGILAAAYHFQAVNLQTGAISRGPTNVGRNACSAGHGKGIEPGFCGQVIRDADLALLVLSVRVNEIRAFHHAQFIVAQCLHVEFHISLAGRKLEENALETVYEARRAYALAHQGKELFLRHRGVEFNAALVGVNDVLVGQGNRDAALRGCNAASHSRLARLLGGGLG